MAKINKNQYTGHAREVISQISQQRNWHKGLIDVKLASAYKKMARDGIMQNDTAEKILYKLGYNKIQKEIWVEINQNL